MLNDIKTRNLVFFEMILISMSAVSIPALIPTFQYQFGLSISQSALIPIISTVGGFLTNIILSFTASRIGLKKLNLLFLLSGLVGTAILAFSNDIFSFFVGIVINGIAIVVGLTNSSNIFAHLKKENQNYGFYHACFGIGGIIAPAIISVLLHQKYSYQYLFGFVFILYFFTFLIVAFSKIIQNTKYDFIKFTEAVSVLKKKYVSIVILIMVIYAGAEQGSLTWSGNLFADGFGFTKGKASLILSIFWVAFTFGRFVTFYAEKYIGQLRTVYIFTIATILFLVLLIFSQCSFFFIGIALSMSVVFPILQKYTAQRLTPKEVSLFNGLLYAAVNIGGVIISGSMGLIGDYSIRLSYIIPTIANISIIFLILYLHNWNKKTGEYD
ncbi:MAG: MFS transporter [Candidatus Cloacimonadota bacterium]|nr:MFS transporter [Candidatus Cloacimonadota bacterium]